MKKNLLIALLLLATIGCASIPSRRRMVSTGFPEQPDSVRVYYMDVLGTSRYMAIGPSFFLNVEKAYRTLTLFPASVSSLDSALVSDFLLHLKESKTSTSKRFVRQEGWMFIEIPRDSITYRVKGYKAPQDINTYYVIESIYRSERRDTVSMGFFNSDGIYHSDGSYITEDNGLYACLMKLLIKKDPEWAGNNAYFLRKFKSQ